MIPGHWETRHETTAIVQANSDSGWEQGQAVRWGKGERVRFWIYLLDGRVSRIANDLDMIERRGIKDGSRHFNLSSWRDGVVINRNTEGCRRNGFRAKTR